MSRRRPPWWVSVAGLAVTLAATAWLIAEAARPALRVVGIR